ncbi:MAG TPA: hypothetical protein PLL30_13670 [Candidatus Krumholzibacteria bacterium]|nr:hypothetical protein [Candidatus Krumholzibacteria bacterium]HPD72813.1 hypothetical protein [Candidatus Krumholzibacteria bacterium]HRY40255.1 hypothetical protein [Candidatus Krumholzibacteria bacterium]
MVSRRLVRFCLGGAVLALGFVPLALAAVSQVKTGDFEGIKSSADLRRNDDGQDWYESRKESKEAGKLLMLSTKKVAGNATHKAMIKAHPTLNTYLSQDLAAPQTGRFTVSYDICVKQIRPEYDRSAFFFAGTSADKKNGPNSTAAERFVFLGFANAGQEGKIRLFAREGKSDWKDATVLADGLDLMKWYQVTVDVDVAKGTYTVKVGEQPASRPLAAFSTAKSKAPTSITHISFASWNDGAGTFYVDNVSVIPR